MTTSRPGRGKRERRKSNPSRVFAIARNVVEDEAFRRLGRTPQVVLLTVVLRVADGSGSFFVRHETAGEWVGVSPAAAKRAFRELLAAGILTRTPWFRRVPGGGAVEGASLYRVNRRFLEWRGENDSVRGVKSDPPYNGDSHRGVRNDPPLRGVKSDPPLRGVRNDPPDRSLPVLTGEPVVPAPGRGTAVAGDDGSDAFSIARPEGCSRCSRFADEPALVRTGQRGRPLYLCRGCMAEFMGTADGDSSEPRDADLEEFEF